MISPFLSVEQLIMSAAERVQNHPVYVQAQGKANYYVSQLDKEVIRDLEISRLVFQPRAHAILDSSTTTPL